VGVGGVRGGGRRGGAGGARGPSGSGKASGAGFSAKVGRSETAVGPSREVGTGGAVGAAPVDAVTAKALEIARLLKAGRISSRDEATKRLVSDILKQKLKMQSKALTQRIADALEDDPRLNQRLNRLWARAKG